MRFISQAMFGRLAPEAELAPMAALAPTTELAPTTAADKNFANLRGLLHSSIKKELFLQLCLPAIYTLETHIICSFYHDSGF